MNNNDGPILYSSQKDTWYFTFNDEQWTPGPPMLEPRDNHGCGSINVQNVKVVVVAGGLATNTVEFLFQEKENASWLSGEKMFIIKVQIQEPT